MFESEIARGSALLDEKCPGWENEINLGSLDLGSFDDCVLGQIYGQFERGLRVLFGIESGVVTEWSRPGSNAWSHGFYWAEDTPILTAEWAEFIRARRGTSALVTSK